MICFSNIWLIMSRQFLHLIRGCIAALQILMKNHYHKLIAENYEEVVVVAETTADVVMVVTMAA